MKIWTWRKFLVCGAPHAYAFIARVTLLWRAWKHCLRWRCTSHLKPALPAICIDIYWWAFLTRGYWFASQLRMSTFEPAYIVRSWSVISLPPWALCCLIMSKYLLDSWPPAGSITAAAMCRHVRTALRALPFMVLHRIMLRLIPYLFDHNNLLLSTSCETLGMCHRICVIYHWLFVAILVYLTSSQTRSFPSSSVLLKSSCY